MRSCLRLGQVILNIRSADPAAIQAQEKLILLLEPVWKCAQQNLENNGTGKKPAPSRIVVGLCADPFPRKPGGIRLFQTRVARVHQTWQGREIQHLKRAHILVLERLLKKRRARPVSVTRFLRISAESSEQLFESAWLALLSILGEELDCLGFHRLHALGVRSGAQGLAFFSNSGVGKSTFGYRILSRTGLGIFGDEVPLLNQSGFLCPLPLPIACAQPEGRHFAEGMRFRKSIFADKLILPIPPNRRAKSAQLGNLIWMRKSEQVSLRRVSGWRIAGPLFWHFVVGVGVPQMAEFMLRWSNLWSLVRIAFSRLRIWARLLLSVRCWIFHLNGDVESGWKVLEQNFLNHDQDFTERPSPSRTNPSALPQEDLAT